MTTQQSTKYEGVIRRGKTYSFKVMALKPDGTRGQVMKGGFKTAREARDARSEVKAAMMSNSYVPASKLTVAEFLRDKWLPSVEQRLRPSTLSGYRSLLETHIIPRLGQKRLSELDPSDLNRLYADLLKDGRQRNGTGGLSPKTTRKRRCRVGQGTARCEPLGTHRPQPRSPGRPPEASITRVDRDADLEQRRAAFVPGVRGGCGRPALRRLSAARHDRMSAR